MNFRADGKEYCGSSALEIVQALSMDAASALDKELSIREFVLRSLKGLRRRIPVRELDISGQLDDDLLALSYLYLLDEYGVGHLTDVPMRARWAYPL